MKGPVISLLDVPLHVKASLPSAKVERFLREADDRIESFQQANQVYGFVPSDYLQVHKALCYLQESTTATGNLFCEWGSGFGVVTCLAAMAEFKAYGIEIDASLVEGARQLADDFEVPVEFFRDSFIPQGSENCIDASETSAWLTTQSGSMREEWGLSPDNFDVIFVYPWPGEERVIETLFDKYAAVGALLLSFHGRDELRLQRKVRRSASFRKRNRASAV